MVYALAVLYSGAVARLRRPFLSDRFFFVSVRRLKRVDSLLVVKGKIELKRVARTSVIEVRAPCGVHAGDADPSVDGSAIRADPSRR